MISISIHTLAAAALTVVLGALTMAAPVLASSGQPAISKAAAEKIALSKVAHGRVKSAELENEMHKLVWSFDISQPGTKNITEVLVNAHTGKIIAIQHETTTQQAAEISADKAATAGH